VTATSGGARTNAVATGVRALRQSVRLLRAESPGLLAMTLVLGFAVSLLASGVFLVVRWVLDGLGTGSVPWGALTVLAGLALVQMVSDVVATGSQALLRQISSLSITERLMAQLARLPFGEFESSSLQGARALLIRDGSRRPAAIVDGFLGLVGSILGVVVTSAAIAILVGPLPVVAALLSIPALVVEFRYAARLVDLQTGNTTELLRMQYLSQLAIDPRWQRELRVFGSDIVAAEYKRLREDYNGQLRRLVLRFQARRAVAGVFSVALTAGVIFVVVVALRDERDVASAGAALLGLFLLSQQLSTFAMSLGAFFESAGFVQLLTGAFDDEGSRPNAGPPPPAAADRSSERPRDDGTAPCVELAGVTFAYDGVAALENVSFVLRPGLSAIVGANGAGKSTLVKLLVGLYEPTAGSVRYRGLDRSNVVALFQDSAHIRLSVRQVVTMSDVPTGPDDDDRLWAALADVGLDGTIRRRLGGLDTVVGAGFGGQADLSGGEWQRLALARIVFHAEARLLVFDEPSASLDQRGEEILHGLFDGARRSGRIVVAVTHRIDTILRADEVVELHRGRVAHAGALAGWLTTKAVAERANDDAVQPLPGAPARQLHRLT
jgi:ATP-binding cassette subfamily B protein